MVVVLAAKGLRIVSIVRMTRSRDLLYLFHSCWAFAGIKQIIMSFNWVQDHLVDNFASQSSGVHVCKFKYSCLS